MVKQNKNNKISVFGVLTEHFTRCLDETLDKHNRYRSLIFDEEVFRAGGVEVAEVGVVVDAYMRTEGVLGAVEVEVAIGAVGIFGGVADEVSAEAVTHPYSQFVAPRVGKRLLIRSCRTDGQHTGDALTRTKCLTLCEGEGENYIMGSPFSLFLDKISPKFFVDSESLVIFASLNLKRLVLWDANQEKKAVLVSIM